MITAPHVVAWIVCAAALLAILVRPCRIPEWVWAVAGAAVLVGSTLVPLAPAVAAVGRGVDVYLFLAGMMMLAELARTEGVFDWLASQALRAAQGSRRRLFLLVYVVGTVVTTLLSNDATAVVLTPAVFAALARTDANPMPFLYICAFIANAASFVLPISNPANLVVFDGRLPPLGPWLASFGLPALIAVAGTFVALYAATRADLQGRFRDLGAQPGLSPAGRVGLAAVLLSAAVLVFVAAIGKSIGIAALTLGILSTAAVACVQPSAPRTVARQVSWSVIPLVAGLFVIVQALDSSGVLELARAFLRHADALPRFAGGLLAGSVTTIACTLLNNLPVALVSGFALQSTSVSPHLAHATLVAVDLGPNLSVTGSLATLLWLIALRRDGFEITPWQFMRLGFVVLVPALVLSLLAVR